MNINFDWNKITENAKRVADEDNVKEADRAIDIQSKLGNILANRQPMNPGQGAQVAPAASNDGFGRTN